MPNSEYDDRVDDLLNLWRDEIYNGVLIDCVLPAIQIYAHASLQDMTDDYDVPSTFPMFSQDLDLYHQYGNALFCRLSSACTSIHNALQAIHARMDYHAAIAIARRAHESLWQMFWICNPTVDGDERIKRLLILTNQELKEARPVFSGGVNPQIEDNLKYFQDSIERIVGKNSYRPRLGWTEYGNYFSGLANATLSMDTRSDPVEVGDGSFGWKMMSNITHPNAVFDWIIQQEEGFQDRADKGQMVLIVDAMGMVANLSTLMMLEAELPEDASEMVNGVVAQPIVVADYLLSLKRS